MQEKIIAVGAEAVLIENNGFIIKRRNSKKYRYSLLDERLRKQRTKREKKLIEKASKLVRVPKIFELDDKYSIKMELIRGKKLSECLDNLPNRMQICEEIGKNIALLHDNNIIHGDLTTANILLLEEGALCFIDFGLGFESSKIEDKAVDLHLLKEALKARHIYEYDVFFKKILEGYRFSKSYEETIRRLEKVEKRGRYKGAV